MTQITINTYPVYTGQVKVNNAGVGSVTVDHNTKVNVLPGPITLLAIPPDNTWVFKRFQDAWDKPGYPAQTASLFSNPATDTVSSTASNEVYTAVFEKTGTDPNPAPTSGSSSFWTLAGLAVAAYILRKKI